MIRSVLILLSVMVGLSLSGGQTPLQTPFSKYGSDKGTVNVLVDYRSIPGMRDGDTYKARLLVGDHEVTKDLTVTDGMTHSGFFSFEDAVTGAPGEEVSYEVIIEFDGEQYSSIGSMHFLENPHRRKLVMEEGTGTWCGYCTRGAYSLELMGKEFEESFIGIAVHFGDVMTFGDVYTDGMKEGEATLGLPCSRLDRSGILFDPYFDVWQLGIGKAAIEEPAPAGIKITGKFTDNYNAVELNADIDFDYFIEDHNYGLAFVLTENNVSVPGDISYFQNNNYGNGKNGYMGPYSELPGVITDMVYAHVARGISSYTGADCPLHIEKNHAEVSYRMPLPDYLLQRCEISCVAMLMDLTTGEIVNANSIDASDLGIDDGEPLFLCDFRYPQLPRDFLCFDIDANTPDASTGITKGQGWSLGGENGEYYAYSTSWYSPAGTSDDWLISPAIKVSANSDLTLSWESMSTSESYQDSYQVFIADENATVPEKFTNPPVISIDNENPSWTKREVIIKTDDSKALRFAFRNITSNGEMLRVRDIKLVDNNYASIKMPSSRYSHAVLSDNILYVSAPGKFEIKVMDVSGKILASCVSNDSAILNLNDYKGIMLIQISGCNYSETKKLIIN